VLLMFCRICRQQPLVPGIKITGLERLTRHAESVGSSLVCANNYSDLQGVGGSRFEGLQCLVNPNPNL